MTTQAEQMQLMMYVLGWLDESETERVTAALQQQPDLRDTADQFRQFLTDIHRSRLQKRARGWQKSDALLDQIGAWVLGDLVESDQLALTQIVNNNSQLADLARELQSLADQLETIDRPDPFQALRRLAEKVQKTVSSPPLPTLQSSWGLRGGDELLPLLQPADYPFQIQLFVGGVESNRVVQGQLVPVAGAILEPEVEEARTWLIPTGGGDWHKATVAEAGRLLFATAVPPGSYTLEMAWSDEFLEIMDVAIPEA